MKIYTLNPTPVRTANNFEINDIRLDLELPTVKEFENVMIITSEMDKLEITEEKLNITNSKIGIEIQENYSVTFKVKKDVKVKEPIFVKFDFDEDNKILVDNIKLIMEDNSEADFIMQYSAQADEQYFHHLKQESIVGANCNLGVIISNQIGKNAKSFISIEDKIKENSKVDYTLIEFGGQTKISNYYAKLLGDFAKNNLKTIYLGTDEDIIDINYNIEVYGKSSKCNIELQGAISGKSKKSFKGTIDFKQGCQGSKGVENENCILLSDEAKSKSLPMLLCKEENVEGEHGVSSGKIDESKLFYLMTKGISYEEAKKLIVKANFNKIIKKIKNEQLENSINYNIEQNL